MKPPTCSRCQTTYILGESSRGYRGPRDYGKHPLLLRCGHTFCRPCLRRCETSQDAVRCPSCQTVTTVGARGLTPDVYTVGLMWSRRLELERQSEKISARDRVKNKKKATSGGDASKTGPSCTECQKAASCQCPKCESALCTHCFTVIHSKSVGLRKHRPVPLSEGGPLDDRLLARKGKQWKQCASHHQCQIEYYCLLDQQLICSRCVIMGNHKGHDVQTLEDKNKEALSEMEPAMLAVQETIWRLDKAEQTLTRAMPQTQVDTGGLIEEVHSHFTHLHSLLQAREEQLVEDIREAAVNATKPFEETTSFLQKERAALEMALMEAAWVSQGNSVVEVDHIMDQLKTAAHLPCVVTMDMEAISQPVRCSFEASLTDSIGRHGKISTSPAHQMVTLSVPGPDAPKPPPEELPSVTLPDLDADSMDTESVSDSASVIVEDAAGLPAYTLTEAELGNNRAGSGTDTPHPLTNPERASSDGESGADSASVIVEEEREEGDSVTGGPTPQLTEADVLVHTMNPRLGASEGQRIQVTHIRTPGQFYVQLLEKHTQLETLQRHLHQHCRGGTQHRKQDTPHSLHPGTMVMAQFSLDKSWYRGVVTQTYVGEEEGGGGCDVFFMDYGNSERVALDRLRPTKKKFESAPAFAYECRLHGVMPANQARGWTEESVKVMLDMTSSGSISIKVLEEGVGALRVDVVREDRRREMVDQRPVSLIHTLLFHQLAVPTATLPPNPAGGREGGDYISLAMTQDGEVMDVTVTHTTCPSLCFLQPWQNRRSCYLQQLTRSLQDTYSGDTGQRYSLYCPSVGMLCVAQWSQDGRWYRARVTGLGGQGQVKVVFVDYGNMEMVHVSHLRKITHNYIKFPQQAIQCHLVDVEPAQEGQWSDEALTWFQSVTQMQVAQLRVIGDSDRANSASGVLYVYTPEGRLCCVNAELVQRGFANTTGPWSQTACYDGITLQPALSPPPSGQKARSSISPQSGAARAIPLKNLARSPVKGQSQGSLSPHSGGGTKTITLRNLHRGPKEGGEERERKEEGGVKSAGVEVVVSGYQNPAHFYIQLQDRHTQLLSLMSELACCEVEGEGERGWKVGEFCAVKYSKDDRWYRAKITAVTQNDDHNVYQVQLVDYGHTDAVSSSRLRGLRKEHGCVECFAERCHLAGVAPAGSMDSTQWSATAVSFMADEIRAKRLFVKLEGNKAGEQGLPVDILIEELIPETALDPLRLEYLSLVTRLLDHGLAIPLRASRAKASSDSEGSAVDSPVFRPLHTTLTSSPNTSHPSNTASTETRGEGEGGEGDHDTTASSLEDVTLVEQCDLDIGPHPPPTSSTLIILPTHIDSQGLIYAHDWLDEEACTQFMDQIDHYAKHDAPRGQLEVKVGQLCLAFYEVDGAWYRARLTDIGNHHATVKFIDYGNTSRLDRSLLRFLPPELSQRHELAYHFNLHNLQPHTVDSSWPPCFLEYMEKWLVNTKCTAVIKGDRLQRPLGVELWNEEGESLSEMLLQIGVVRKEDDMEELYQRTGDITNILQHSNPYFPLRPGGPGTVLTGLVTHMELPNLVYIQRCGRCPGDDLPEDMERFAAMMDDLNAQPTQHAALQELPAPGEVCCARFSVDDRWYRALVVTATTLNTVLVLYVDYGNSEEVTLDRLCVLPPQFRDMAAQALRAFVNVDLPPAAPRWSLATLQAMSQAVFMRRHVVLIKFADPLTVELFSEEDQQQGAAILSYQPLINTGLLALPYPVVAVEDGDAVVVESCTEEEGGKEEEGEEGKEDSSSSSICVSDLD